MLHLIAVDSNSTQLQNELNHQHTYISAKDRDFLIKHKFENQISENLLVRDHVYKSKLLRFLSL